MAFLRLLQRKPDGEIVFREPTSSEVPAYAILSHTWGEEEVIYEELKKDKDKSKTINKGGWRKIQFCANQAKVDGLEYFWVDTCCINKTDLAELGAAINSMFRWYRNAARCYVYLIDISTHKQIDLSLQSWEAAFGNSRWFTRGWTLQELIAPPLVDFFCSNGNRLGDKESLAGQLYKITGIPASVLRGSPLSNFGFDERVLWARNRYTKLEEDLAYSLLGMLDISMPVIYGEGKENAFRRLRREWKYRLDEQATLNCPKWLGMLQQTLVGHNDVVCSVAFSPDSRVLASASLDKTVRLWDAVTGALQQMIKGHSDWVWSMVFSPDSRLLASASEDKTVRLWDVASGALQQTIEDHNSAVRSVAFSLDSRLLASASGNKVRLWDVATGALQHTLEEQNGTVWSVAFFPDSSLRVSHFEDKAVRLWNVATSALQPMVEGHNGVVCSMANSPDMKLQASASGDKKVRLRDAVTGALQQTIEGHNDVVCSVVFSPDSRVLASASGDKTVRLWDAATGALQQTLEGHNGAVWSVVFSPDSRLLASASGDKTVRLWGVVSNTL